MDVQNSVLQDIAWLEFEDKLNWNLDAHKWMIGAITIK